MPVREPMVAFMAAQIVGHDQTPFGRAEDESFADHAGALLARR